MTSRTLTTSMTWQKSWRKHRVYSGLKSRHKKRMSGLLPHTLWKWILTAPMLRSRMPLWRSTTTACKCGEYSMEQPQQKRSHWSKWRRCSLSCSASRITSAIVLKEKVSGLNGSRNVFRSAAEVQRVVSPLFTRPSYLPTEQFAQKPLPRWSIRSGVCSSCSWETRVLAINSQTRRRSQTSGPVLNSHQRSK